jgi:hypothetical protein
VLEVRLPDKTMDQTLSDRSLSVCALFGSQGVYVHQRDSFLQTSHMCLQAAPIARASLKYSIQIFNKQLCSKSYYRNTIVIVLYHYYYLHLACSNSNTY